MYHKTWRWSAWVRLYGRRGREKSWDYHSDNRAEPLRDYILSRIERKERAMMEELHRHITMYQELEFRALQAEPRLSDDGFPYPPESHQIEEGKTT